LMIASLLFLRRRSFGLFFLFAALAISFYEVSALVFGLIGLGLIFKPRFRMIGLILFLAAAAYLVLILKVIMPHFSGGDCFPHWERYARLGSNPARAAARVILHPLESFRSSLEIAKIKNIFYLFQAAGFFCLFSPLCLLPALPLIFTVFLSGWALQMDIRYGYLAPAVPIFLLSALFGARRCFNWPSPLGAFFRRYGILFLLGVTASLFIDNQIARPMRDHPFQTRKNLGEIRAAGALIPPAASLSADNHLGPHFSAREILLYAPRVMHGAQPVEYIFLDLAEDACKDRSYWKSVGRILRHEGWGPVYFSNGVVLLKLGARNEGLTAAALEYLAGTGHQR